MANNYTTNPSEMNGSELRGIIADIFTAKNWKQSVAKVNVNGAIQEIEVSKIDDYRNALKIETNKC